MNRIALLFFVCSHLASAAWADEREKPGIPKGVKLSLELDKDRYFLGENVLIHLCVENTHPEPFTIDMGGDYRGSPRHLRFRVLATDEQGKEVPDPDPNPMCMGGLSYSKEIKMNEKHFESLRLLRYRRFERPGTYKLTVSHDFGWGERDTSKLPTATATITFVMPNEKQALQVVEEMAKLPKDTGGSAGKRREPFADFATLIYPVYLGPLARLADAGDYRAFEGIGSMPRPEATKELIRLLDHKDAKIARVALKTLTMRLPDPALENKIGKRNPFEFDYLHHRRWLVEHSWKPEFAPAVRKAAQVVLKKPDVESLQCGAYILECLGTADDAALLVTALDQSIAGLKALKREEGIYPRPRGACQELVRAARLMAQRGVRPKADPKSAGELVVFACTFGSIKDFRPEGWEEEFVRALKHDAAYVREIALDNLPVPPPATAEKLLPTLLVDPDIDVQIAACKIAERWKVPQLREPVLKALRGAREHWHFYHANNAALALGAERERIAILVDRLDEEKMTSECLTHLVCILADTNGYGYQTTLDIETSRACKKAWQRFLNSHGDALAAGKKFKMYDPVVPLADLFPRYTFEPPRVDAKP